MLKKENPVKVKRSRAALPPCPEAKPTQRSRNEKGGEEVEAMNHILKYEVTHIGVVCQQLCYLYLTYLCSVVDMNTLGYLDRTLQKRTSIFPKCPYKSTTYYVETLPYVMK